MSFSCFGIRRSLSAPGNVSAGSLASDIGTSGSEALHPAAEALRNGRLGVSFSGGGFLLPYFIGVAEVLTQLGVLRPGTTPVAGSSAGSLVASSLASGLSPDEMYDSFLDSVRDCRTNGSYRRLMDVVSRQLQDSLPADAAARCSGVATVGITRLFPHPHTKRVSSFSSREDLISALLASCHIPRYFNGELTTSFRGKVAIDGGVTALMPVPAGQHDFVLKVCCFPRAHVARLPVFNRRLALKHLSLGITPDAFGPWPYSIKDMLAAALHPHTDDFIVELRQAGRSDALRWAQSAGLAQPDLLPSPAAAAAAAGPGLNLPPVAAPGGGPPAAGAIGTASAAAEAAREAAQALADVAEAAPGAPAAAAAAAVQRVQEQVAQAGAQGAEVGHSPPAQGLQAAQQEGLPRASPAASVPQPDSSSSAAAPASLSGSSSDGEASTHGSACTTGAGAGTDGAASSHGQGSVGEGEEEARGRGKSVQVRQEGQKPR